MVRSVSTSSTKDGPGPIERLDVTQLGRLVRERRGPLSLRQAAAEAGVSFSTMSRVEAGAQPDLASFSQLCAWIGRSPGDFFTAVPARRADALDEAMSHLHADPRLTPEAAAAITNVLKEMYEGLARRLEPPRPPVACHLRAAPVMRPGVPARLGALLQDLQTGLERLAEQGRL
jgi:transcriptional regulator with XRE-family HTH domain